MTLLILCIYPTLIEAIVIIIISGKLAIKPVDV